MSSTCQHSIGQRVKSDHFGYFKGKIVPGVSLGYLVVQGGYFKGKIGSLPKILAFIYYVLTLFSCIIENLNIVKIKNLLTFNEKLIEFKDFLGS